MKRFLQENPHFIDVLRTAAKAAESNGNDYVAGTVQRFADELEANGLDTSFSVSL